LNVLVQLLTELPRAEGLEVRDPWGALSRLADAADQAQTAGGAPDAEAPSGLAVDLSFFAGPFGSTGSITGVTTENLTVGELFAAAFRTMAANYAHCAARIDPARSWRQVVLSGSMGRTLPMLRRSIQQHFAAPLRDAAADEETLLGLLKLASQATPR
jgi:hypothetical protein